MAAERKKNLEILSSVTKRKKILDAEKAANRHMAQEQKRYIASENFQQASEKSV